MNQGKNQILLESGTNEIEIFEFIIDGKSYGVNALKVREAVQHQPEKLNILPMMPEGMVGTCLFRDGITKIIDLRQALDLHRTPQGNRPIVLYCEFNRQLLGFVVDEIRGIYRVSWASIQSPSPVLETSSITGIAVVGDREISMLDLESIIMSIFGMDQPQEEKKPLPLDVPFKILVADDSPMFRKKIRHLLEQMQAKDVEMFENGADLYVRVTQLLNAKEKIGLVLSDIEMPQVDGFSCCKRIKVLDSAIPVVILSSLINDPIARKCKEVGADVAINKQDFHKLHEVIEGFLPVEGRSLPHAA